MSETPNQPPASDRPRFVELGLPSNLLLDVRDDYDALRQLAPNTPPDEIVEKANEELEVAVKPIPPNESIGGKRPGSDKIYDARSAFFATFGMHQKKHPLNAVLRNHSTRRGGGNAAVSPEPFIRNFRLLSRMGAFLLDELRMADFFTRYNDPSVLDTLESTFQDYDLSIWDVPKLAACNPDTIGDFLADTNANLERLRLPVSLADIVRADPVVVKYDQKRIALFSSIALTHGSLESYLANRWPYMARSRHPTLREQLASDIALVIHFPVETLLESVLWTGEADITIARKIATNERGKRRQRASLLSRLTETEGGVELVGASILRRYLAYEPLSEIEQAEHPALLEFMPPPPTLSLEEDIRTKPIGIRDASWLQEAMRSRLTPSNIGETLKELNTALLYGSQSLRHQTPEQRVETLKYRLSFFELLGWTSRDHPFHAAFMQYSQASKGNLSPPDYVVSVIRSLSAAAEGRLLTLLQPSKCAILRTAGLENVEHRLREAHDRAKKYQVPVQRVFEVYPNWFVSAELPVDGPTSKLHVDIYGTKKPRDAQASPDALPGDPPEATAGISHTSEVADTSQPSSARLPRAMLGPVGPGQPSLEYRRALNEIIGTFDDEDYTVSAVLKAVPQLGRLDIAAIQALRRRLYHLYREGVAINPQWLLENVFARKPPEKKQEEEISTLDT
jgi:hypothetical protein